MSVAKSAQRALLCAGAGHLLYLAASGLLRGSCFSASVETTRYGLSHIGVSCPMQTVAQNVHTWHYQNVRYLRPAHQFGRRQCCSVRPAQNPEPTQSTAILDAVKPRPAHIRASALLLFCFLGQRCINTVKPIFCFCDLAPTKNCQIEGTITRELSRREAIGSSCKLCDVAGHLS